MSRAPSSRTRRTYAAATNVGTNPTFHDGEERHVEAYLLDFDGDLYGQCVTLEFLHRLRDELKFDGVEALSRRSSVTSRRRVPTSPPSP